MPPATTAKKQYNREYRLKHRDELNAKSKAHRAAHPEQAKASRQKWYAANRDKMLAYYAEYNATKRDPAKQAAYYASVKDTPHYKARSKEYRVKNRERLRAYFRDLNAKRKDYSRAHRKANAAHYREQHRAWCKAHREQRRASNKKNRLAHLAAHKAGQKAWRLKNREAIRAKAHADYIAHKAEKQAYNKAYYKRTYQARFSRYNEHATKRRRLKKAATVNLKGIRAFMDSVKSKPFATCYYCGDRVSTKGRALHFDHIVSLSQGGQHTVDNLCVSCASCNLSKHAKPLAEWLKTMTGQQLLTL